MSRPKKESIHEIGVAPRRLYQERNQPIRFKLKSKVIGADKQLKKIYLIEN